MELQDVSLESNPEDFFYYPQAGKTKDDKGAVAYWTQAHEAARELVDQINKGVENFAYPKTSEMILLKQRVQELDGLLECRQSASQILMALVNLAQVLEYVDKRTSQKSTSFSGIGSVIENDSIFKKFFNQAVKIYNHYRVAWSDYQMPAYEAVMGKKFAYDSQKGEYAVSSIENKFPEQQPIKFIKLTSEVALKQINSIYGKYTKGADYSVELANLRGDHRSIKEGRAITIIQALDQFVKNNIKQQGQNIIVPVAIILSQCLPRWTWTFKQNDQDYAYEKALKWLCADVSMNNFENSNQKIFSDFLLVVSFSGEVPKLQKALCELGNGLAGKFDYLPVNQTVKEKLGGVDLLMLVCNPGKLSHLSPQTQTMVLQTALLRVIYAFRAQVNLIPLAKAAIKDLQQKQPSAYGKIHALFQSIIQRASFTELLNNLTEVAGLKLASSDPYYAICQQFQGIFKIMPKQVSVQLQEFQQTSYQKDLKKTLVKTNSNFLVSLSGEAIQKLSELVAGLNSGSYSDLHCHALLMRFLMVPEVRVSKDKALTAVKNYAKGNAPQQAFVETQPKKEGKESVKAKIPIIKRPIKKIVKGLHRKMPKRPNTKKRPVKKGVKRTGNTKFFKRRPIKKQSGVKKPPVKFENK
jgi:hypothetical protein